MLVSSLGGINLSGFPILFQWNRTLSRVSPRYCYHWLKSLQETLYGMQKGGGVPHVYPKNVAPLLIPLPCPHNPSKSLQIQAHIASILDKFGTLTSSLSDGLPLEIALRQKQYEYYRNLLLSFPVSPGEAPCSPSLLNASVPL